LRAAIFRCNRYSSILQLGGCSKSPPPTQRPWQQNSRAAEQQSSRAAEQQHSSTAAQQHSVAATCRSKPTKKFWNDKVSRTRGSGLQTASSSPLHCSQGEWRYWVTRNNRSFSNISTYGTDTVLYPVHQPVQSYLETASYEELSSATLLLGRFVVGLRSTSLSNPQTVEKLPMPCCKQTGTYIVRYIPY
jgi:hypothetical protein